MRKIYFLIPLFLVLINLVSPVFAEDLNLTDFPKELSEAWNISEVGAGLFLSLIFAFAFLVPLSLVKVHPLILVIVGFSVMSVLVGIGWLHYWILILIALIVAVLYASKIKGSI